MLQKQLSGWQNKMAVLDIATQFDSFVDIAIGLVSLALGFFIIKSFSGGKDSGKSWGSDASGLKEVWSSIANRKADRKGESPAKAAEETGKEKEELEEAEDKEERAILNEFLWLGECKKAIKKYYETDNNLHLNHGSTAKKSRPELHERRGQRDLRNLHRKSESLLKFLKNDVEPDASAAQQDKINQWRTRIESFKNEIVRLMSITPKGEFEKELNTAIPDGPNRAALVKKKYENLVSILDKALELVKGLAAINKGIKAEFDLK